MTGSAYKSLTYIKQRQGERVLFIGTQFSILYTSVYPPAGAAGDMQLQQHTWQVLAKSIVECPHQRILLGGECQCQRSKSRICGVQH
jgi:hypothetical protein